MSYILETQNSPQDANPRKYPFDITFDFAKKACPGFVVMEMRKTSREQLNEKIKNRGVSPENVLKIYNLDLSPFQCDIVGRTEDCPIVFKSHNLGDGPAFSEEQISE